MENVLEVERYELGRALRKKSPKGMSIEELCEELVRCGINPAVNVARINTVKRQILTRFEQKDIHIKALLREVGEVENV
jgi:hypothetical protein